VQTNVLLGRDANGLYAMSSLCTHEFCNLDQFGTILASGIQCDCHGSVYDSNGNNKSGPAPAPLVHYALALGCDGFLYVDTNTVVPPDTRLLTA
jgi:Rieske Fe-S protein